MPNCIKCGESVTVARVSKKTGKSSFRAECDKCRRHRYKQNGFIPIYKRSDSLGSEYRRRYNEWHTLRRKVNIAGTILSDSRKSDKKRGFDNDLTLDFVETAIKSECLYCGETQLRKTLDRVDNNKGHIKTNVITACIRCNYLRRDMPMAAWLHLAQGVRVARESGAFGNWIGGIKKLGL